ncbi:MAG: Trk system potassium transporter TrkA [Clostridia bacterium]|nr:Trk system potassium transporter TrkA [Clostridia bacterium]
MQIVIIGLGSIGKTILRSLSNEGHTVTIIDENKSVIENLIEKYDVFGVVGNGACMDIQKEADAQNADLVIALTKNDELNIFACMVAKRLGVKNTVARVRNPDYRKQIIYMKEDLGISMIVNPERETANEIFNLISLPSFSSMEHFAKGKVLLAEVVAREGSAFIGESLISLGKKLKYKVLICAVQRGGEVVIPSGNFVIENGDKIHFAADARNLGAFLEEVNLEKSPLKKVMIVGGGRIGYYLADALSQKKYKVKLIEKNPVKAEELAEALPKVAIACGNGTRHDLLEEEGIEAMDAFVSLTDVDEENIIASMFANQKGVKKAIAQIHGDDLIKILDELGIDNKVSPNLIAASRIISYARALSNSIGSNVQTLYQLVNSRVEALEFAARKKELFYGVPLKDLNIKKNCLIACIIRNGEVIIPNGNFSIELGDNVVVVTTQKNFDDLHEVFE